MINPFYALYPHFHYNFSSFTLSRSLSFSSFGHNKSYSIPKCFSLAFHSVSLYPQAATSSIPKVLQHWLLMMHFPSQLWEWGLFGTSPWEGIRQGVPFSESLIYAWKRKGNIKPVWKTNTTKQKTKIFSPFICAPVLSWICADWLLMDWWPLERAWGSQGRVLLGNLSCCVFVYL